MCNGSICEGGPCLNYMDYINEPTYPFMNGVTPDLTKMNDYFFSDGDTVFMLANFTYNATAGNCSNLTVTANFSNIGGAGNANADLKSSTNSGSVYMCIFNATGVVNFSNINYSLVNSR